MGASEISTFSTYDSISRKSEGKGHRYIDNINIEVL